MKGALSSHKSQEDEMLGTTLQKRKTGGRDIAREASGASEWRLKRKGGKRP